MQDTRLSAISAYVDAGYRLFDCFTYDKSPCQPGWQQTPAGSIPTSLTYGVLLGLDDLLLDYDTRRDPDNNQLVLLYTELGLEIPQQTYTVRTGNGAHIYFRKPIDLELRGGTVPGYPAIEIKTSRPGHERYVIGAGSLHPSGLHYETVRKSPHEILEAPEALLIKCRKPEAVTRAVIGVSGDDSEWNCKRFIQWIQAGNHAHGLYVIANQGKDYGLSPAVIVELIDTYANPFWFEPASREDIELRVNNAFEYGQNAPGVKNTGSTAYADLASAPPSSKLLETFVPLWDTISKPIKDAEGNVVSVAKSIKPSTPSILAQACLPSYRDSRTPTVETANPLFDLFRYNQFSMDIEFKHAAPWHHAEETVQAWRDVDASLMSVWLSQHTPIINAEEKQIIRAVKALAYADQYHPVRQYLMGLQWDGVPRLDRWLHVIAGAADTVLNSYIGRYILIAACARVFKPGCQHDSVLVLEGAQDAGKTSIARILGGPFYADVHIDPRKKDTYINMLGAWFLEMSEMAFLRDVDVESTKRFVTITADSLRLPYETRGVRIPRQSVFVGTVNPKATGYLRDITGNRRFWTVAVAPEINLALLRDRRDQLFAEAYARFVAGEQWHFTDKTLKRDMAAEQRKRMSHEIWQDDIEAFMMSSQPKPEALTTVWLATHVLGIPSANKDYRVQNRIQYAMTMLGYVNKVIRLADGSTARAWVLSPS